ncbi:MAG: hypothetical protein NTW29_01435 [Bacteroidetes bacterium]|nr:hypothetical protein [Bacteroidota bacterium]
MSPKLAAGKITWIVSALVFLVFLVYRVALIYFPMQDVGGVEGNVVYFIQRLLDGQTLYSDPEQSPYAIAQYSPGYYYIVTAVARITSTGPDDLLTIFAINRCVSLFFNLAFLFVVYSIARRVLSLTKINSFIAAALTFVCLEISSYGRPDSLHHFLFMLSLFYLMQSVKYDSDIKRSRNFLFISSMVAALALFAKQTSIVIPLLAGAWLLSQKKIAQLLRYGFIYIATVGVLLLLVFLFLDIKLFYKNVVLGINNGISPGWFLSVIVRPFYLKQGTLLLLLFLGCLYYLRKDHRPLSRLLLTLLVLLFLLLNILMLKNGANLGYLTEWWTLVILVSLYYTEQKTSVRYRSFYIPHVLLCGILMIKLFTSYGPLSQAVSPAARTQAKEYYLQQQAFAEKIKQGLSPGDQYVVFLNIYTPDSYLANILFRHTVLPQMDIVILSSYPMHKYDYADFERSLYDGRIKWLVMYKTGPQKKFFNLNLDKFELVDSTILLNLYQYQP